MCRAIDSAVDASVRAPLDVSGRKRALGGRDGFVGSDDVDPGPGWERELVAAERAGQSLGAVEPAIVQQ